MAANIDTLIESVASAATDWDFEHAIEWEIAFVLDGLLAAGGDDEFVRELVDRCIETQTSEGQLAGGSLTVFEGEWEPDWTEGEYTSVADPSSIGHSVLELYDRTGDDRYLDAARRQYEYLRDSERTSEGGIRQQRSRQSLCVDGLWMFCPFLARYGRMTDTEEAVEDAVHQFEVQARHLHTDSGLFRHTWAEQPDRFMNSAFWTGGNGFALMALVDTLEYLPADHEGRETLTELFRETAAAMLDYQDRSGFWHNVVDDPHEPLETSGTLMTAYALQRGTEMGILTDSAYAEAAERAMSVCRGVVSDDGRVGRVAKVPGGRNAPLGVELHGQGLFLLTASQFS